MARRWWEVEPQQAPASPLARRLPDDEFYAQQQAVEDELFARDRADDSQTQRALNQSMAQLQAAPKAVKGLARVLAGDEAGGEDLRAAKHIIDREAQFAPDVQTLEDIQDTGDLAAYGRNAVLSNLPTMVPTLAAAALTGGTSAAAGGALRGLATRGLAGAVGRALTARTGAYVGALAGSSALQANQMLDVALDENSPDSARTRAAKATIGAVATGALDALPEFSLLNRMGLGGAAKRAIGPKLTQAVEKTLAQRLGKEVGTQALQEGATEAIQSVGERLTHKWVNDNVEVLGPKAFSEYLNSAVAGALTGGVLGGAPALAQHAAQGGVRGRVKADLSWFKSKRDTGPVPVEPEKATKAEPATDTPATDLASELQKNESAADPAQQTPGGFIRTLFGKHADELNDLDTDEDSLLDGLENRFREIDRDGLATSDENGIIGRTQNDGFVRGGIPFSGFSLFNADQAQNIWETAKRSGQNITVGDAFAITSLAPGMHEQVGDKAIKAAGKYLLTGDRAQVNEDDLATYLKALTPDQRLQFVYAANRTAENIAKGREAEGVQELTPHSLRRSMDSQTEALKSSVDIDDKVDFDLAQEFGQDTGDFADFQQQQAMDTERPVPVSLNEVVGKLPFVDARNGTREGAITAINSKGNKRDISLASLVAQGWQAVKDGVFTAPNGVVDVVAQAIDTLQQRGLKVDPNQIKAGLWIGGRNPDGSLKTLSAAEAKTLREGLKPARARPVQETPGAPRVPDQRTPEQILRAQSDRPYSNLTNEGVADQEQGEDGVENMDGEDTALRTRTRRPLEARVDVRSHRENGQEVIDSVSLTEAETVDTEAADDAGRDARQTENAAIRAMARVNSALKLSTPLRGSIEAQARQLRNRIKTAKKQASEGRRQLPDNLKELMRQVRIALDRIETDERGQNDERSRPIVSLDSKTREDLRVEFGEIDKAAPQLQQPVLTRVSRTERQDREGQASDPAEPLRAVAARRAAEDAALAAEDAAKNDSDFDPDDFVEAADAPANIEREQSLLDTLTDKLGIERITLLAMPEDGTPRPYGQYSPRRRTILLGNKRTGNARLDTLLHELGHAIAIDLYDKLSDAQKAEITAAYNAWLREASVQRTYNAARKTRAPFFIKKWLDGRQDRSRQLEDLTESQLEELLSFDEFLADQLARALGKNETSQGVIHQFFKDLAAKLRELYELFSGSKYEPAPSVEAWVESLFRAQQSQALFAQPIEVQQRFVYAKQAGVFNDADEDAAAERIRTASKEELRAAVGVRIPNPTADAKLAKLLSLPNGQERLLNEVKQSRSISGLSNLLASLAYNHPNQRELMVRVYSALYEVNQGMAATRYGTPSRNTPPNTYREQWRQMDAAFSDNPPKTVAEAAARMRELFSGSATLTQQRMLKLFAESKVLSRTVFDFSFDPFTVGPAGYFYGTDTVTLSSLGEMDNMLDADMSGVITSMSPVHVLLHEATHALTQRGEKFAPEVRRDLDRLLAHVRKLAEQQGMPVPQMYALSDTQEFLAEAFSNPVFQDILREMPALGTSSFKNAWDQFKNLVAKLLGLPTTSETMTALEEALTLGLEAGRQTSAYSAAKYKSTLEKLDAVFRRDRATASGIGVFFDAVPPSTPSQPGATPSNLFSLLNSRDRGILEKALRDRGVFEQIVAAADPDTQRKLSLYGPDMVSLINLGAALHAQGKLDLSTGKNVFTKLLDLVRKTLGLPSNANVAEQILNDFKAQQIKKGYDAEAKAFSGNEWQKHVLAVQRGVTRVVQPVMDKLTTDVGTRLRQTNNPALRKLATLIETRNAENAGEESYAAKRQRFMSQHATAYMEAVQGLKDEQKRTLARALQEGVRPDGVLGTHYDKIQSLLEQYLLWGNANGVTIKRRQNYFPVVMDRKRVEEHWDELVALLSKPEYEADIRSFFQDNKTGFGELVDRMVQIAQTADTSHVGEVDFSTGLFAPAVNARRQQIMGFITSKLGGDRAALAKFQTDSLDAIMLGYVNQLSKRAAYVKTFGAAQTVRRSDGTTQTKPDRIGQLIAQAKTQGATPEQLALARDFVNMAIGSYHAELNPAIRWVFTQVDKVWGSQLAEMPIEQWAHYQQAAMVYQNIRLLGLASLSSLIDPMGSMVRGGSVGATFRSMWDAARAMRDDGNDLRQMAEDLGVVEKYALTDALAATYGGSFDPQGKLGKINNALFKFNGLEAITRHSRLTALAAAHRFLIRHSRTPNEHSARLLAELGLEASDIQVDARGYVERSPKIDLALRRFVAEAVVRPSPSQRPGWHNDPNFQFAAQYKGYLYAFYTTIVDRMVKEAEAGNYRQALVPLVPYLGVTVAAEMLRYSLQHPGEDDPRELDDYMRLAMVRSGLVGPRFGVLNDARTDTRYGSWITNSWIGPTGQQVTDLVDVATGERSFGKTAIEALPGSALFEDWSIDNESTPDTGTSARPADPAA